MRFAEVSLPSNRKFGLFFTVISLMAGWHFFDQPMISYTFFAMALFFLMLTGFKSELLLPLNRAWMRLVFLIGIVVSPLVLGFLFYGIFAPVAMLMRLFGRDELRLKLKLRKSHWKQKELLVPQAESFRNQF